MSETSSNQETQDSNRQQTQETQETPPTQRSQEADKGDGGQQSRERDTSRNDDKELAYWRRKAEANEKRAKDLERASLSEVDRLKLEREEDRKRADQAESKLREFEMTSRWEREASKAGIRDPQLAYHAVKSSLTFTEDGKIIGLSGALADLKKSRPWLFEHEGKLGSGGGNTGARATGNGVNGQMNSMIRRASGR